MQKLTKTNNGNSQLSEISKLSLVKEEASLPWTAFYSWKIFCGNHSCVLYCSLSQGRCGVVDSVLVLKYYGCRFESRLGGCKKNGGMHWTGRLGM